MLTLQGLETWYTQTVKLKHAFAGTTAPDPIPLPDVTNVDGLLEGIVNETEEAFVSAADSVGALHGDDVAYNLVLPDKLYRWYGIKKVGGKTLLFNQAVDEDALSPTPTVQVTITKTDHVFTFKGTTSGAFSYHFFPSLQFYANHVYVVAMKRTANTTGGNIRIYDSTHSKNIVNNGTETGYRLFTTTQDFTGRYYINCGSGISVDCDIVPQLYDLTVMFGEGNEPATVDEFKAMFPLEYYAYGNVLMDVKVTSIISKDADDTVLDTIDIPAGVQALTGYGYSSPDKYNYIDFDNKKFVQNVGQRAYASGDESDPTVITDGTHTNYNLVTPVETSITITGTDIAHEAGGSITFENTNKIPVPVNVGYVGK